MQFLNGANQSQERNLKLTKLEANIDWISQRQDDLQAQCKMIDNIKKLESQIFELSERQEKFQNRQKIKPSNQQQLSLQIKQLEQRMIEMDNLILNCNEQPRRPEIFNLENTFKNNINVLKKEVQQEYKNIYKEMNGLKCDIDYVVNNQVKAKITHKIKTQNINLDSNKLLFINLLELETFIEELDQYEAFSTQRLLQEIKQADQEYKKSLKYQLAGTKRKYLNEIKKIEHKFKILSELVAPNSPQEKYTIQLNQQMNQIVSRLHKNIDTLLLTFSEYQII